MKHDAVMLIGRIHELTQKWLRGELASAGLPGVAPSHGDVLALLFMKGEATMHELAAFAHRTKATTTVLVYPPHDGRQTPMRGHPVFVAQHAITAPCGGGDPWGSRNAERTERSEEVPREPSACCCRDCLAKWECARAEGVGLGEREARTAKQPQGPAKVPRGVAIPAERQQGIVDFLMACEVLKT